MSTTADGERGGERRPYRMRKRREDIEATRQRIVDAAVDLHGSVGPRETTFSAVAARAGVQRSTLYRHFPDDTALFQACTSHWLTMVPPPDPADWRSVAGPGERLEHGLTELYEFYTRGHQMLANSYRDLDLLPPAVLQSMVDMFAAMRTALLEAWPDEERPRHDLQVMVALAVDFRTWQLLAEAGMQPSGAARLVARMVTCAATEG